jgi:hypothetical protein
MITAKDQLLELRDELQEEKLHIEIEMEAINSLLWRIEQKS